MLSKSLILLVALLSINSVASGGSSSSLDSAITLQQCRERTGLTASEIKRFSKRNEGCTVDCITSATIMSLHTKKGTKCGPEDYACVFGQCKPKGESNLSGYYQVEIRIISAHVPDLDSLPMGGPSDAFVVVEAHKHVEPAYEPRELMCHTYVIQDNGDPKWTFKCKPLPLKLTSQIKFDLFDSDKPSENLDHIGYAIRSVEDLLNKGPQRLQLTYNGREDNHDYHVVVEVTGQEEEY